MKLRGLPILLLAAAPTFGSAATPPPTPTALDSEIVEGAALPAVPDDLYVGENLEAILLAARALMEADENMALVTVDADGQPRARTVRAFPSAVDPADPKSRMTVWVMTREAMRKVEQIKAHPQVTLFFNDDARNSYLTIMGSATVHTDPSDPRVKPFLGQGYEEFFWPEFPKGFVMIEVLPRWIEFMGLGISNHREHWRPQAVTFPP